MAPPDLTAIERELGNRAAWKHGIIASINVVAAILAARLIFLLSVVGAFILAWRALTGGQTMQLGAVGLYAAAVVLPACWLASRR